MACFGAFTRRSKRPRPKKLSTMAGGCWEWHAGGPWTVTAAGCRCSHGSAMPSRLASRHWSVPWPPTCTSIAPARLRAGGVRAPTSGWPPDTVRLYDLVRRNLTLMIDCRHHYFTTVQDDNAHRDSITALTTATQFLGAVFFRCSFFVQKNDRRWLRSSTMETCILIPPELSVMLRPTGRRGRLLEMEATLWTNCALRSGFTLLPDDGELRLDRLELFADLSDKDVRTTLHDSP